jgi:hypothetical protein
MVYFLLGLRSFAPPDDQGNSDSVSEEGLKPQRAQGSQRITVI